MIKLRKQFIFPTLKLTTNTERLNLNVVSITNLDILRIMKRAFDGLDVMRIQLVDNGLRIFGIDKASTAYYNMLIRISSFYEIRKGGVTVSTKTFTALLDLALSGYLTKFEKFDISIENDSHAIFAIKGEHTEMREIISHVTSGIKTDPPHVRTIDFSRAAKIKVKSPRDYRLVYEHFNKIKEFVDDVEPIEIAIVSDGAEFKPVRHIQRLHKVRGEGVGEAKSQISLPNIKLTSEVTEVARVKTLEIYVLNDALMKFKYTFNSGFLEYIIAPAIAPEY